MSSRLRLALAAVLGLFASSGVAAAHVEYVTDRANRGEIVRFLASTVADPFNAAVLLGGFVAVVGGAAAYLRFRPAAADVRAFRTAMSDYRDLLPWLLRLSVGLPLVGSGFAGYLFSPTVPAPTRLFGVAVGFFLLFGLATRFAAAVGLVGYLVALASHPDVLLAFEYVPGFLAIVLLGGGRPSADEVIARAAADDRTLYSKVDPLYRGLVVPFRRRIEPYRAFAPTAVRVGLGLTFLYLGFADKLANPAGALAVVERYSLTAVVPVSPELWVVGAGLTEALVGIVLLLGVFTRAAAGVAFLLFTTTLFALPDDPVVAHISLFGLVSVLLITGAGPLAIDSTLSATRDERGAVAADAD